MVRVLAVDPAGLSTAGIKLGSIVLPPPPAPVATAGRDSAAAAIDSVLPGIESPVIDGLSSVASAVARTGSNIASAAAMYAEIDQRLSDQFGEVGQLSAAAQQIVSQLGEMSAGPLHMASQSGVATALPVTAIAGVAPLAQTLAQGVQSAAGSMSGAGPISALLTTDSSSAAQPNLGQTDTANATNNDDKNRHRDTEAQAGDGRATPGRETLDNTPVQGGVGVAGGQPQAIPPATSSRPPTLLRATTPAQIDL